MNLEHLKAILWLRWRLSVNQWRKAGELNFVLMMIFVCSAITFSALSFFIAIALGVFLLPKTTPMEDMIVWDVIIGALLFSWSISLLIEIQRMELLSLEKLLHLPMTLKDAFLLNYLSSLFCLNILCFFPAAIGLSVAMSILHGLSMLILIPSVLAFVLMLTAVTYQFRGWIASMMSNKRRQRTVIMLFTFGFIALAQVPNIVVQLTLPGSNKAAQQRANEINVKSKELKEQLARQEITIEDYDQQLATFSEAVKQKQNDEARAKKLAFENYFTLANQILPVGWLPYACKSLRSGTIWPAGLCLFGMTLIGSASLWRSYRSTLDYYTGNNRDGNQRAGNNKSPASAASLGTNTKATASNPDSLNVATNTRLVVMERRLPFLAEHPSAVAVVVFRI